jgi:hypothetical protein
MYDTPIVVSLAVMGCRVSGLEHTLFSIINNTLPPNYLNVFYSTEPFLLDPGTDPRQLEIVRQKVLSKCTKKKIKVNFICTPNIGSFRKLIPVLQIFHDAVIITIDDDRIYDAKMIETYVKTFQQHNCIIAARVRELNFEDDFSEKVINDHNMIDGDVKSLHALPEGCGGILYHTSMFDPSFSTIDCRQLSLNILHNDDLFFRFHTYTKGIPVMKKKISYLHRLKSQNSLYHVANRQLHLSTVIQEVKTFFSSHHEQTND